jgi:hypothetical protein
VSPQINLQSGMMRPYSNRVDQASIESDFAFGAQKFLDALH